MTERTDVMQNAEEIADKLKECLELVGPNLVAPMKLREAVDVASEGHAAFAKAFLDYLGTDTMEDFIDACNEVFQQHRGDSE